MAQIQKGSEKREIIENRPNEVISVAEVRVVMIKFTDKDGFVDNALALCFGKDREDGKLGVFAINGQKLSELLTIPHKFVKDGVRKYFDVAEEEAVLEDAGALPHIGDDE